MMPLILERLAAGENVQFTPRGTSMRPMIYGDRDHVVLSPVKGKLKKYDIPLYKRDNGQYVLHRIVKVGETYTMVGDNQYQREPGIRPDQLLAVVSAFVRDGKLYSVTDPAYRAYCRIWHFSRPLRRCIGVGKRLLRGLFAKNETERLE
jgi:hypothetical protein